MIRFSVRTSGSADIMSDQPCASPGTTRHRATMNRRRRRRSSRTITFWSDFCSPSQSITT